jgi:hypothetical protein
MTCDGCGGTDPRPTSTEYGLLCPVCEFRQFDYEERAAVALSPSTYGFLYADE